MVLSPGVQGKGPSTLKTSPDASGDTQMPGGKALVMGTQLLNSRPRGHPSPALLQGTGPGRELLTARLEGRAETAGPG